MAHSGETELDRRYAAFISYRHVAADRDWAKWLVESLESYRTPRVLVAKGFPSRIGLLYRDEDENPASAALSDQIKRALAASDALIVVASRNTQASRWIDREVSLFEELGRRDRIFVLLTDGEPAQAYPRALLVEPDREPIAADVRPRRHESRGLLLRRAKLRLVAALFRCNFDDLFRRDRGRARRRWAAAFGLLIALVLAGGWAYLVSEQTREQLRLDQAAATIAQNTPFEYQYAQRRAAMFAALSESAWPYARLPPFAREMLGRTIRTAAIWRLRLSDRAAPVVLEPWRSGVVAGLSDGSVVAVLDEIAQLLPPADCAGAEGFLPCAVTALDATDGRIVLGTNHGQVILLDPTRRGSVRRARPTTQRIGAVSVLPAGGAVASDIGGRLFRVADDGSFRPVRGTAGWVADFVREPRGSLLVVRGDGRIERLSDDGSLVAVARYEGPVRAAGFIGGRFYLVRVARTTNPSRGSLLEGTPENAVARPDGAPVVVEDSSNGVFFGLNGRQIVVGSGPRLRLFDVVSRTAEQVDIEPPPRVQESREIAFGFFGSIAASADGRWLFSVDQVNGTLMLTDLHELARINRMLLRSRNVRRDLCRPDMRRAFLTLGLPPSVCA